MPQLLQPSASQTADRRNAWLIALLGLTLGGLYFVAIDLHDPGFIFSQQQHVLSDAAGSPYRYRVLVPLLLEAGTRAFASVGSPQTAFLYASAVYDCVGFIVQLMVLYVLARQWFSAIQSLLGVALTSCLTIVTLAYFTYQPWSILEVALFGLGFVFAYRGHWGLVTATVVIAALNRETGVFLPLALFLGNLEGLSLPALRRAAERPETRLTFGLVVLSTAIFAALRLVRGSASPADELIDVITRNLERNNLIAAGMAVPLFLGIGWIFAALGLASAPPFVRRIARVVPFYLLAFAIWGWWREVRILTSLYPILLPLVLSYCYLPRSREISVTAAYTPAAPNGRSTAVQRQQRHAKSS